MLDVVYVAIVIAFFTLSQLYARACDRGIGET
jgi:hypothetical protein